MEIGKPTLPSFTPKESNPIKGSKEPVSSFPELKDKIELSQINPPKNTYEFDLVKERAKNLPELREQLTVQTKKRIDSEFYDSAEVREQLAENLVNLVG